MTHYINFILAQVKLEGFEEVSQLGPLFALLVSMNIILAAAIFILFKISQNKENKIDEINKLNAEKIDTIRLNHINILEKITNEMIEKENIRYKEARESEKETLNVLKGVNTVLEMSEKMKINDTKHIFEKLNDIKNEIKSLRNNV